MSYIGDAAFLEGITDRTGRVKESVEKLLIEENKKGGVLKIDTENVSSILSHKPGYIIEGEDIIVGLQTDEPLKRAVNPFAGYRNAIQACKAYGYEMGEKVKNQFKYHQLFYHIFYTFAINFNEDFFVGCRKIWSVFVLFAETDSFC